MYVKKTSIILFVLGVFLLMSCTKKNTSKIMVFCEKKSHGEYLLKWEIYPEIDNASIDIFASESDTSFSSLPTHIVKSDDYISIINIPDSIGRAFFQLKVGDVISDVVSNRFFEMDSIQNFRDIGGYYSIEGEYIRWGKIFRSGNFSNMTLRDKQEIEDLNIKTVIDFRSSEAIRRDIG